MCVPVLTWLVVTSPLLVMVYRVCVSLPCLASQDTCTVEADTHRTPVT